MRIKSFAKINLGLEVLRRRTDGFHEIRTLFQSMALHDVLEFRPLDHGRIELDGTGGNLSWGEDNLVHQAARMLSGRCAPNRGAAIQVTKNIPVGAGLGGGSSNAAMTLWALNRLWGLDLAHEELAELGAELGSDVPYFLTGGLCLGTGRGDLIEPLKDFPSRRAILVLPRLSVSTAHIYRHHRAALTSRGKDSKIRRFLTGADLHGLENDLEDTIFRFYPLIQEHKRRLLLQQPELALVSGSGAAVFGLYTDEERARAALQGLPAGSRTRLVETVSRDRYWDSVSAGV